MLAFITINKLSRICVGLRRPTSCFPPPSALPGPPPQHSPASPLMPVLLPGACPSSPVTSLTIHVWFLPAAPGLPPQQSPASPLLSVLLPWCLALLTSHQPHHSCLVSSPAAWPSSSAVTSLTTPAWPSSPLTRQYYQNVTRK